MTSPEVLAADELTERAIRAVTSATAYWDEVERRTCQVLEKSLNAGVLDTQLSEWADMVTDLSGLVQPMINCSRLPYTVFLSKDRVDQLAAIFDRWIGKYCELLRIILIYLPELEERLPESIRDQVFTVRIPLWAYLRSMWNLFWSAVRHPLSETTIDLSTGRVLYRN